MDESKFDIFRDVCTNKNAHIIIELFLYIVGIIRYMFANKLFLEVLFINANESV